MTRVLLALGANLGERTATLAMSLARLARLPNTQLLSRSTWHKTAPVGGPPGQGDFLNGAVLVDTSLSPIDLASGLRQIETQLGRQRHTRWNARQIDIDLLLFGDQVLEMPDLEIPHPRMGHRRFVLDPACEIAAEMVHPRFNWTLAALSRHWQTSTREVTVNAADPQMADWLAGELNRELGDSGHDCQPPQAIELVGRDRQPAMVIVVGDADHSSGPVVRISSTDRAVVLQEAAAAIRAAWPD